MASRGALLRRASDSSSVWETPDHSPDAASALHSFRPSSRAARRDRRDINSTIDAEDEALSPTATPVLPRATSVNSTHAGRSFNHLRRSVTDTALAETYGDAASAAHLPGQPQSLHEAMVLTHARVQHESGGEEEAPGNMAVNLSDSQPVGATHEHRGPPSAMNRGARFPSSFSPISPAPSSASSSLSSSSFARGPASRWRNSAQATERQQQHAYFSAASDAPRPQPVPNAPAGHTPRLGAHNRHARDASRAATMAPSHGVDAATQHDLEVMVRDLQDQLAQARAAVTTMHQLAQPQCSTCDRHYGDDPTPFLIQCQTCLSIGNLGMVATTQEGATSPTGQPAPAAHDAEANEYALARAWHGGADDSGCVGVGDDRDGHRPKAAHSAPPLRPHLRVVATAQHGAEANTATPPHQHQQAREGRAECKAREAPPDLILGCLVPDKACRPTTTTSSDSGSDSHTDNGLALKSHPDNLCCPITYDLFIDPVVAGDGFTYERVAIEQWLQQRHVSPLTRDPISRQLYPNTLVRKLVNEYREAMGIPPPPPPQPVAPAHVAPEADGGNGDDAGMGETSEHMNTLNAGDLPLQELFELLLGLRPPPPPPGLIDSSNDAFDEGVDGGPAPFGDRIHHPPFPERVAFEHHDQAPSRRRRSHRRRRFSLRSAIRGGGGERQQCTIS